MLQFRLTFRKIYTKEELNGFHNTIVEERKPRFSKDEKTILTTNKTSSYFLTILQTKYNELLWGQNHKENLVRTKKMSVPNLYNWSWKPSHLQYQPLSTEIWSRWHFLHHSKRARVFPELEVDPLAPIPISLINISCRKCIPEKITENIFSQFLFCLRELIGMWSEKKL